jgi:hypothetical protein
MNAMFGTAWRAAPWLATTCVLVALSQSVLSLAYPLGFRAIVDGAAAHQQGRIVTGLVSSPWRSPARGYCSSPAAH